MMGIYGVVANLVASRVREIGIRMALGATPAGIGKLVLLQGMLPVLVGLAGSLALGRFLEALLLQVRARDPLTLGLGSSDDRADFAARDLRSTASRHARGLYGGAAGRVGIDEQANGVFHARRP
jgi:hypothetical protein